MLLETFFLNRANLLDFALDSILLLRLLVVLLNSLNVKLVLHLRCELVRLASLSLALLFAL